MDCIILQMDGARQIAALPVRYQPDGGINVLLVTSRETRRWVIPKGWPWPDCADWLTAAGEALEEAGIVGRVHRDAIGSFTYHKRYSTGLGLVRVSVYLLEVTDELETWPEQAQRKRAWFAVDEAIAAVDEPELQALLHNLPNIGVADGGQRSIK